MRGVMWTLQNFITANAGDSKYGKMSFLLATITDELVDELADKDDATMEAFLAQIGLVISWIGHGDNDQLPDSVRPFAERIQPTGWQEPASEVAAEVE